MDFVSDALFGRWRLKALTVVDAFTREALATDVDHGIKGKQVVAAVTRIASVQGCQDHSGRQWSGVHLEGVRQVGV